MAGGGSTLTTRGGILSITGGGVNIRVGGLSRTGGNRGGVLSTRGGNFGGNFGLSIGIGGFPPPGGGGGFELIGVIGFCNGWKLFGWQTFTTTLISMLFQT